jgi:hypothetical protein
VAIGHVAEIGDVSAFDGGQAVGVNFGTVQQLYFHGPFLRLRDVTIDLDPLPGDLRLVDPHAPANPVGLFIGRGWLLDRLDAFLELCVRERRGGFMLIEAEAGMGKSALAAYLAFIRAWPAHFTRLAEAGIRQSRGVCCAWSAGVRGPGDGASGPGVGRCGGSPR